jgi:hypothetical protein
MTTPQNVADWMIDRLRQERRLKHATIVPEIQNRFGSEFTYTNQNGNIAIDRRVLRAFRDHTAGQVVWDRSLRGWRPRRESDPSGRRAN